MSFERNENLTELVNELYEAIAPLRRGDTIGHDRIAAILGVAPHEGHWQDCLGKVKRRLEDDRGITLWSEHEVGYRLLTVQEQLTIASRKRLRRAKRQIRLGLGHVTAVSDVGLTPHQRRLKAAQIELMKASKLEVEAQYRRQSTLMKPTRTNPRLVVANQPTAQA